MVVFSGTESKPEALFRENFKWSVNSGNFYFWSLQCQQFRFSKLKKQYPRYYKTSRLWLFFVFFPRPPFFLKDQNWGEGMPPLMVSQPNSQAGVHQKQNLILECFSSLKSRLYRGAELPHFHNAVWEKMHAGLSSSREKASVGSYWPRCQDVLERFPVAHNTFQEMGSQEHHGWEKHN